MADDDQLRRDLLARIEWRRAAVQAFLRANRPRIRRRANVTIVLSSLAAVFTAGPALGGEPFAEAIQDGFGLRSDSIVWQVLCLAALLVSISAAVMTHIAKSQDADARLSTFEAVNAELVPLWEPGQTAYVCGSESFAEAASQKVVTLGFPPDAVRVERFGPSGP